MNKNDSLHILFKTLADILPYEYNEKFLDGEPTDASIVITKEGTSRIMYISEDTSDHDDYAVSVYDDDKDDKANETFYWITEDPATTIQSIVSDIKNRF